VQASFQISHTISVFVFFLAMVMSMVMPVPATTTATLSMMVMVVMVVFVMVMVMSVATFVIIGSLFRAEGALHRFRQTALPACELFQFGKILRIKSVRLHLDGCMPAPQLPSQPHQPQRVFSGYSEQPFGRRPDNQQAPVFQLERVAIIENDGLFRGEFGIEPAFTV